MISHIQGSVILANTIDGSISVMTQSGVGYIMTVGVKSSMSFNIGEFASLFVEQIVKEDSMNLYGFKNYEQQTMFNSLLKVSGVGPKVAMNVLDNFSPQEISRAIIEENAGMFQKIGGLGEKVSARIIAELKKEPAKNAKILSATKIGKVGVSILQETNPQLNQEFTEENDALPAQGKSHINIHDVTSALVNLGFDYNRSFSIASSVTSTSETIEEAIMEALRKINN